MKISQFLIPPWLLPRNLSTTAFNITPPQKKRHARYSHTSIIIDFLRTCIHQEQFLFHDHQPMDSTGSFTSPCKQAHASFFFFEFSFNHLSPHIHHTVHLSPKDKLMGHVACSFGLHSVLSNQLPSVDHLASASPVPLKVLGRHLSLDG